MLRHAVVLCAMLAVVGCEGIAPIASPSGSASNAPNTTGPSFESQGCGLLALMHQALRDLAPPIDAARAGDAALTVASAAAVAGDAQAIRAQIDALGSSPAGDRAFLQLLIGGYVNLAGLVQVLVDPEPDLSFTVDYIAQVYPIIQQELGSADALALSGTCPGFVPPASALPTLAPLPTPSDGPIPPGSMSDQTASALRSLGLLAADGIEFSVAPRIRWLPTFILRDVQLTNRTDVVVQYPFDLTILLWDGTRWAKQACREALTTGRRAGLCAVINTNGQPLVPAGTMSGDGLFFWPGTDEVAPGTYALILPIWRTAGASGDSEPIEAAAAIVTVTTSP